MSYVNRDGVRQSRANVCYNCKHSTVKGGHYVPPSIGDEGFYACEAFCDECKRRAAPPEGGT